MPFFIPKPHANSSVVELEYVEKPGVLTFKYSPTSCALQIRTKTTKQGRIAQANLTREECLALAQELIDVANTLEPLP